MKTSVLILTCLLATAPALAAGKPNIIIILADDLGYADLGCQGCQDIPTPHIDSIAASGVRFTDGYATHPVCSPSRAGLVSGMYQHRFGFEHNSGPERYASPKFGVPRSIPTLAERLKAAGYATAMAGKWHIGFKEGLRPHERGFDSFYGFLSGARSFYPDPGGRSPIVRNGTPIRNEPAYLTDALGGESAAFIERSKGKPFFLYLSFNAVHSPLEATSEYEDRFPNITERKRKTYAGMTAAMDDAVGEVLSKLREHDLEANTLVFFYSDNGGPTWQTTSRNDPLRGFKTDLFEGGIRVPFLVQWKGVIPAGLVYGQPVMGFDVHATALAAAGLPLDSEPKLDGVDLLPFLKGEKAGPPHERLFWRSGRSHAVREGDWKLVHQPRAADRTLLFNLAEDIGEQTDLSEKMPEKLKQLEAAYQDWTARMMEPQWIRQDQRNAELGGKLKPEAERTTSRRPRSGRGRFDLEQAFKNADRNNDGKLARDEYPRPEAFPNVDANKDGFATLEEVQTYFRNRNRD